jgi:hypothetical protein
MCRLRGLLGHSLPDQRIPIGVTNTRAESPNTMELIPSLPILKVLPTPLTVWGFMAEVRQQGLRSLAILTWVVSVTTLVVIARYNVR